MSKEEGLRQAALRASKAAADAPKEPEYVVAQEGSRFFRVTNFELYAVSGDDAMRWGCVPVLRLRASHQ